MCIKVFFVGNTLVGDDGIASFVYERIKDDSRLVDFELLDAGVAGLSLVGLAQDLHRVLFVDAVKAPLPVGTVLVLDKESFANVSSTSAHDLGLEQVISMLGILSPQTETSVIGIVIEQASPFSQRLSPILEQHLERICSEVIEKILKITTGDARA